MLVPLAAGCHRWVLLESGAVTLTCASWSGRAGALQGA